VPGVEVETHRDQLAAVRRVLDGADEALLGVAFVQRRHLACAGVETRRGEWEPPAHPGRAERVRVPVKSADTRPAAAQRRLGAEPDPDERAGGRDAAATCTVRSISVRDDSPRSARRR